MPASARRTETMLVPWFRSSSFSHFLGCRPWHAPASHLQLFDSRSLRCSFAPSISLALKAFFLAFSSLTYLLASQLSRGSEENAAGRRCSRRLVGARSRALATPSVLPIARWLQFLRRNVCYISRSILTFIYIYYIYICYGITTFALFGIHSDVRIVATGITTYNYTRNKMRPCKLKSDEKWKRFIGFVDFFFLLVISSL